MLRPIRSILASLAVLGLVFGAAAAQQDAQPAPPLDAPADTVEEVPDIAYVRVVNFSPNSQQLSVSLTRSGGDEGGIESPTGFQDLAYRDTSDYVEVAAGNYRATLEGVSQGEQAVGEDVNLRAGRYYTLAAIGLVLPPDAAAEGAQQGQGGFVEWVRGLFGGNGQQQDALQLQLRLFEDELVQPTDQTQTMVRVVHAAPGTEPIALGLSGEQGTLARDISFGQASRYAQLEGAPTGLEIRVSGSRAATIEVPVGIEAGTVNTVYLIGTALEQAPIQTVAFSSPMLAAGAAPTPTEPLMPAPAAPGATPPADATTPDTDATGAPDTGAEPETAPDGEQPAPAEPGAGDAQQDAPEQPAAEPEGDGAATDQTDQPAGAEQTSPGAGAEQTPPGQEEAPPAGQ